MNKMIEAAKKDGITLKLTDAYRVFEIQDRIFRERYTTTPMYTVDIRWYQGKRWYRKPNQAAAAIPGTSNHGLGLAVDFAGVIYAYGSLPNKTISWLNKNAKRFGWVRPSWSFNKNTWEPWHWEYVAEYDRSAKLEINGPLDKDVYTEWQDQLGKIDVDGIFGKDSISRVQARLNGKNGKGGYKLAKGPLKVTGKWNKRTVVAVQKLLNLWDRKGKIKLAKGKLDLTGEWDYRTVAALRKSLNAGAWT